MNETQWLGSTDPAAMLTHLRANVRPSHRRLRLFAVACCRACWGLLTDPRSRRAVDVAERFADGAATEAELSAAHDGAARAAPYEDFDHRDLAVAASEPRAFDAGEVVWIADAGHADLGIAASQAALLRDVIGNPFRPYLVDGNGCVWRGDRPLFKPTPTVLSVARRAYDERDFAALPVLADALEDAGCEDADILAHCRHAMSSTLAPPLHVRGCWALDLVLGKQ